MPLLRRRLQRLREHDQPSGFNRYFAGPRPEEGAARSDDVAEVDVVQRLEVALANLVAADERLYPAGAVAQVYEGGAAHQPQRRDTPAYVDLGLCYAAVGGLEGGECGECFRRRVAPLVV